MVSWCSDRFYLKHLKLTKEKLKNSPSVCRLALCWSPPLTLIQAFYNSALVLTSCLYGARRPQMWKPSLLRPFLSMYPGLGHVHDFLNSLVYAEAFKSSHSHIYLFSQPLSSLASWSFYCLSQLLQPVRAPLNVFSRSHLGTCPSSGNAQSWAKQGQPLHQSLMGVGRQVETHSHNFLTKMSVSLPSSLHQEYGLLFS